VEDRVAEQPVKTMHPFVAAAVGLAFLAGCGFLFYAGVTLVRSVPTADAAAAYQTTVWGLVGLVLSGAAGARLTGGDNPLASLASAVSTLTGLVRR
jgi:hypothetical protein